MSSYRWRDERTLEIRVREGERFAEGTSWTQLLADLLAQTSQVKQILAANRVDRYITRQALALFLVAPQVLYAVNKDVDFVPYATSFELAETSVRPGHWSLR
jgi:hypothetical protein